VIAFTTGFLLPIAASIVLLRRAVAPRERLAVVVPLIGTAIGLASTIAFGLMAAGVRRRALFVTLDVVAWLAILVAVSRVARYAAAPEEKRTAVIPDGRPFTIAAGLLLAATLAIALIWFVASSAVYPHGEWDAWAQWNLRARFFFRGFSDGTWRSAFATVLAWSHPDYPLLVPMSVARLWLYGGIETVLAPIALGGFMAAATVTAAGLDAAHRRGAARGCLAAAIVLACPSFVRYSAAQCADVALGFYILCAFIFWSRAGEESGRPLHWALAGAAVALAGWTKNEGLVVLGLFVLAVACERFQSTRSLRAAGAVLAGAAPVLIVIVLFKLVLSPPSYFTAEQSLAQAAASLIDGGRLRLVGLAFARELWLTGASVAGVIPCLALFVIVRGIDADAPVAARVAIPLMAVLLGVYAIAYLISPKDLGWQLQTSLDRVVLHVVPTLTWAVVTVSR
jgi:hypothetical protein